ncbi:MAG: type II toxin-antitoxin system VapC family toxin [Thermaerobacter sp.]|nr:type II toxin-antitoxin system VapC family toxin [Thermaerobacter sp.]
MGDAEGVLYWDTSAVLSTLMADRHTDLAVRQLRSQATHLLSSLAWAEAHAVLSRLRREGGASEHGFRAAQGLLAQGPWQRISSSPDWAVTRAIAVRWHLRGADLWHLAMAKSLQRDLPEITMLTYDVALQEAAMGEGLASHAGPEVPVP